MSALLQTRSSKGLLDKRGIVIFETAVVCLIVGVRFMLLENADAIVEHQHYEEWSRILRLVFNCDIYGQILKLHKWWPAVRNRWFALVQPKVSEVKFSQLY